MKTAVFFAWVMLLSLSSIAQHPLVGTWKLISLKGKNVDGKPFSFDTTTVRETKIITPTHYMLIAEDVREDSLVFNRCYAGTIRFDGNKFFETPFQASLPIFDGVKTDFKWKVEGDIFTQSGTITRPDGKKVILEALKFKRVKESNPRPSNPAIGAWSLTSSTRTLPDGAKHQFDPSKGALFQLITPTHWMRIRHENGKFDEAIGGTYQLTEGKTIVHITEGRAKMPGQIELAESVNNNQLSIKGSISSPDGKVVAWDEVFNRVKE